MSPSRQFFVFAIAFTTGILSPKSCPADVMPRMPENIVISGMDDHGDLIFVLFVDGQFDKGFLLDPRTAGQAGEVQLPFSGETNKLPVGKLSLLGVPRALAEKNNNKPDPAWLTAAAPPGVVRVTGLIHNYRVQKGHALHRYQLDKTEAGLKLTLLNPDVLEGYPPEDLRPAKESQTTYLWLGLVGALAVLTAGVVVVWILKRRGSQDGPST